MTELAAPQQPTAHIGIDISKGTWDVHLVEVDGRGLHRPRLHDLTKLLAQLKPFVERSFIVMGSNRWLGKALGSSAD